MPPQHGTESRYNHYRCRCAPCTAAAVEADRRRKAGLGPWQGGKRPTGQQRHSVNGYVKWGCQCAVCTEAYRAASRKAMESRKARGVRSGHRQYCGSTCERCGFVPVDLCQLEVHHMDRDRKNNAPENLETLCANCHRLHHYTENGGRPIRP